jgi:hypothetical protein
MLIPSQGKYQVMEKTKEISGLREQIINLKRVDDEAKKAYRARLEIEKRLALHTGEVFVAVAGIDTDLGAFREIVGASREVPKVYVKGVFSVKLRDKESVTLNFCTSGVEEITLTVRTGMQFSCRMKDHDADSLIDLTLCVCRTKEQAQRWLDTGTID